MCKETCKKQKLASLGLKAKTFSVLDWRDNQLHHDTSCLNCFCFILPFFVSVFLLLCIDILSSCPSFHIRGHRKATNCRSHLTHEISDSQHTLRMGRTRVLSLLHHCQVQATKAMARQSPFYFSQWLQTSASSSKTPFHS